MISLEKFKKIMDGLQKNIEYLDKICEFVGDPALVFDHACIDETIIALAAAIGCDEEILFQWVFELDFGKDDLELKTAEQLYNYLVSEELVEETIFKIPSCIEDCPDFELTYHPAENHYTMSMETIYQMDADDAGEYVHNIWKCFTDWMIDNGHSIEKPVELSIFETGICLRGPYQTIEDAYAHFTVLAAGVGGQGVVSEPW